MKAPSLTVQKNIIFIRNLSLMLIAKPQKSPKKPKSKKCYTMQQTFCFHFLTSRVFFATPPTLYSTPQKRILNRGASRETSMHQSPIYRPNILRIDTLNGRTSVSLTTNNGSKVRK